MPLIGRMHNIPRKRYGRDNSGIDDTEIFDIHAHLLEYISSPQTHLPEARIHQMTGLLSLVFILNPKYPKYIGA